VLPTDARRLVILTEGQFGIHHAKTAMGVIRYGRDEIVAILDSSMGGRNLSEFLPQFDVPFVGTLDEALARPVRPDSLLIGIAPTTGANPTVRPKTSSPTAKHFVAAFQLKSCLINISPPFFFE
jgi:uncharacterized NAD-dependent epimerase/dehydratase family protein